jgi:hypothetical protein
MAHELRAAVERAKCRLDYWQRQLRHEQIFGPSSRASLRQIEGSVTAARVDLATAQAKLDRAMALGR